LQIQVKKTDVSRGRAGAPCRVPPCASRGDGYRPDFIHYQRASMALAQD